MGNDGDKKEAQIHMLRRHLKEWNDNLALEAKTRQDLETKHHGERNFLYLSEVNYHERARLINQQLQDIKALISQNRQVRIAIRRRHDQEKKTLE